MTDSWTHAARRRVERLIGNVGSMAVSGERPADSGQAVAALDSLGLVELVVAVEAEFSVTLTAEVITIETFSSVDGIVEAVRRSGGWVVPASGGEGRQCDGPGGDAPSGAVSGDDVRGSDVHGGDAHDRVPRVGDVHAYMVQGRSVPTPEGDIIGVLLRWARTRPASPFMTWLPAAGEAEVLSYGELDLRSRSVAASLSTGRDLVGRRIGLLATNDTTTVVAMFALLRAGATCLLLNPLDPPDRLRSILVGHAVSMVFRTPRAAGVLEDLAQPLPSERDESGERTWVDRRPPSSAAPALMFGTSGSTAASKIVVQSHRALLSNAQALQRHHRLDISTTIMGGLPLHHVNGVHFTVLAVVNAGAHVVLPQRFDPAAYRAQIDRHRPHLASVVPTVLETLLATGRGWSPPGSLRYFVTAAAPMTASLARRVLGEFGVRAVQGYGLTETTNFSTTLPIDLSDEEYAELVLDASIPTVGVALHGNEVTVLSRSGEPVADGIIGEVCMRGHNVMEGYADRPDLTAEAFEGGWFHSGDLGYWTRGQDGRRYLCLTGRVKNIAKVRGETVSLEEVERALCSIEGVVDAGCAARSHPLSGEEIVAALVLRGVRTDDVLARLSKLVPAVALPRHCHVLAQIPRTPTGKLRRAELSELIGLDRRPGNSS